MNYADTDESAEIEAHTDGTGHLMLSDSENPDAWIRSDTAVAVVSDCQ